MKTLPSCEVTPTVRTALLLLTLLAILFLHATLRVCIQLPFSAHSGLATGASLRQPASVTVAAAASAAAATSRRTAILTICTGPDFAGVHRFASSARTHAPGSDIVVFTDAPTLAHNPSLQVMYDLYQVKLVIMTPEALPEVARSFSATGTRHIVWRDWMRAQQAAAGGLPAYDMLLFCDSRDTVFQADPFARLVQAEDLGGGKGFYAFLESHDTIGGSEWNFKWVADCFGNEGLAEVQAFPVVCAGTSMGSWEDSMIYLDTMGAWRCLGADPGTHGATVHKNHSTCTSPTPLPTVPQLACCWKSLSVSAMAWTRACTTTLCTAACWPKRCLRCTRCPMRRASS
jgi:hypothetical protein